MWEWSGVRVKAGSSRGCPTGGGTLAPPGPTVTLGSVRGERIEQVEGTRDRAPAGPGAAWRYLRGGLLLVGFAAVILAIRREGVPTSAEEVDAALRGLGPWAGAALLSAFLVRPLFLLPITPLWIGAGAVFGWVTGTLLALVGTSLGAGVGFALARRLGRGFVEARLGTRLPRWTRISEEGGLRTVLALQLTPVMPHDLINGMAGVSRMRYRSFAIGSLLGTMPIIAVYAWVGQAVWEIPSPEFWAAVGILTAMTVLMLAWNRRLSRRREATLSARWSPEPEVEP